MSRYAENLGFSIGIGQNLGIGPSLLERREEKGGGEREERKTGKGGGKRGRGKERERGTAEKRGGSVFLDQ